MKFLHKGTLPQHVHFTEFLKDPRASRPHVLVVGEDVSYSRSPLLQQPYWNGLEGESIPYIAVSVPKQDTEPFKEWLKTSSTLGCNITIPYKQEMMSVATTLSSQAQRLGVLNTLKRESNGQFSGHNTDPEGVIYALKAVKDKLVGAHAIIFGGGGASSSVCLALEQLGVRKILVVRRDVSVPWSFSSTHCDIEQLGYNEWMTWAKRHQPSLFVNATPLGLKGHYEGISPVKEHETSVLQDAIGFDAIYTPAKTPFLTQIQDQGGIPIGGMDMLIGQANASFELWTGAPFQDVSRVENQMALHSDWDIIEPQWNGLHMPHGAIESQFFTRNTNLDTRVWLTEEGWSKEVPSSLKALHPNVAWCDQVHGSDILNVSKVGKAPRACDGLWTRETNLTLAIRVADCSAILLADPNTGWIAALHAGWRGAVAGILPKAIAIAVEQGVSIENLRGWLSPCIGATQFEVGPEVAASFPPKFVSESKQGGNPHVDLKAFLVHQALEAGFNEAHLDLDWSACTRTDSTRYWSYRAMGEKSGRMIALVQNRETSSERI